MTSTSKNSSQPFSSDLGLQPERIYEHRRRVGRLGEELAAQFLTRRGVRIEAVNLSVGRGELDIVGLADGVRTAFEVKTTVGDHSDPAQAFTAEKADQVRTLARSLRPPCRRIDLVTVRLGSTGARIWWSRRAA